MPEICLNMIVKDEAHIITKTFDILLKYITFSYWVICDTGSTDETIKLITEYFKNKNIPGELVQHKWSGFGVNRTLALRAAYNKSDYLLIFDADDSIEGDFILPQLNKDKYNLKFGTDTIYYRPLLLNNRKKWKFNNRRLHEFLEYDDSGSPTYDKIEGDYHFVSGRSGARSKDKEKYLKDALILESEYKLRKEPRDIYYCGQSYKDYVTELKKNNGSAENIFMYRRKAIEWFKKFTLRTTNVYFQEGYVSCLYAGNLLRDENNETDVTIQVNEEKKKDNIKMALDFYEKGQYYDSKRFECVVEAAFTCLQNKQFKDTIKLYHKYQNYEFPNDSDKLFIQKSKYNHLLEYATVLASKEINNKDYGYICCKKIISGKKIKNYLLLATTNMLSIFKEYMSKDENTYLLFVAVNNIIQKNYSSEIKESWDILFNQNIKLLTSYPKQKIFGIVNKSEVKIFLSFTTCKRYDLFHKTINSFINNVTDFNLIDYWFCVDDNSSPEDRQKMRDNYSWIDYYYKDVNNKGHIKSMNIIYDKLLEFKPKWWIHIEDDFLFYTRDNWISKCIVNLEKYYDQGVRQILFNRNYAETIIDFGIKGHKNLGDITLHEHKQGQFNYRNCHYWPHYSFRPSMVNTEAIFNIGQYTNINGNFFEREYADKYNNLNYKSTFFDGIHCKHIGRLTSEIGLKDNAYNLNKEDQFNSKEEKIEKIKKMEIPIKIINLKRREDRLIATVKKLSKEKINDFEIIEAVDGNSLFLTEEIYSLFKNNDFGNRKGVIGCALSHYNLWKRLVADNDNDYYFIMEDDFDLCTDFKLKIEDLRTSFKAEDLIFLGYHMFSNEKEKVKNIYDIEQKFTQVENLNTQLYIGGTHVYTINKIGAKKLLEYINNNGIKHGIDYLIKICPSINKKETRPFLSFADWNENGKAIDSDIQNIYNGFDFTIFEVDLKDKFVFVTQKDQMGYDLFRDKKSINEMMKLSLNNKECKAFNTLGFFKCEIKELVISPYFNENDGIYIKKEYYEKMFANTIREHNDIINKRNVFIFWEGKEYKLLKILRELIYKYSTKGKGYNVILLNHGNIGNYMEIPSNFYKLSLMHQSDVVRVNVICDYGGIWLDSDTILQDNLDSLFEIIEQKDGFFIKENNSNIICNANFGSKANTLLLKNWKKHIIDFFKNNKKLYVIELGGGYLSSLNVEELKNYTIFNGCDNMYPIHFPYMIDQFLNKPYDNYKNIEKPYQPFIILVNLIYKKMEEYTEDQIFNGNKPINYFISKAFNNLKDQFIFLPLQDQYGIDLYRKQDSLNIMMQTALDDKKCVAFNSNGWFKYEIRNLSQNFNNNNEGIYIKTDYYEKFLKLSNYKFTNTWFQNSEIKKKINTIIISEKELKILEIGCFEGAFSVYISDNFLENKKSELYCCDPFLTSDTTSPVKDITEKLFLSNIKQSKHFNKIKCYKMFSDIFFEQNKELFDFIYIDGSHLEEHVLPDLINSIKYLKN